jgi:predicted DNA-binding transcriptional regulator YafY
MIAAEAGTPLDRVRRKLEETFGEFALAQTGEPHVDPEEADLVGTLARGMNEGRAVEIEYLKEGEETPSTRVVEPYAIERQMPSWYVHTYDRTRGDKRSFRLDRMKAARLTDERFEPREGFDPAKFRDATTVTIWYSPAVARWQVEKGARPLVDGVRGEAEVVEPAGMRRRIAERAAALETELGLAGVQAPA